MDSWHGRIGRPGGVVGLFDAEETLAGEEVGDVAEQALFGALHLAAVGGVLVVVAEQMQESMGDIAHEFGLCSGVVSRGLEQGHFDTDEDFTMDAAWCGPILALAGGGAGVLRGQTGRLPPRAFALRTQRGFQTAMVEANDIGWTGMVETSFVKPGDFRGTDQVDAQLELRDREGINRRRARHAATATCQPPWPPP